MEQAPFHDDVAEAPNGARSIFVRASDGTKLRLAIWDQGQRGTILLMPGRTEYIEKYGRVITRLTQRGFSVAAIDWRGQGLSERPPGTTRLGHVWRFAEYQQDIAALTDAITNLPQPRIMIAHSMGGCIGLRALVDGLNVSATVFSAPMWGLILRPYEQPIAAFSTRLMRAIGLGLRHAPGGRARSYVRYNPFDGNKLTSDPEHYQWFRTQLEATPDIALGGPSNAWVAAAFDEMNDLLDEDMPQGPVLTFIGGDEKVVSIGAVHTQMERMPQGTVVNVAGARHEVLMERPEIQTAVWDRIDRFLWDHDL